jgi:predicted transcriptional regulator
MSDDKIIAYAKKFIEGKKIKNKKALAKEDGGLYYSLRMRGLLARLEFEAARKPPFTQEEVERIMSRRKELISECFTDEAIGNTIAEETGKKSRLIQRLIRRLVKKGLFQRNPNRRKDFSDKEIVTIIFRRNELMLDGLSDARIAKQIADELPQRDYDSVEYKIRHLVKTGKLGKNPNKRKRKYFSNDEIEILIKRRDKLVSKGLSDHSISEKIASQMERNPASVYIKIQELVKKGELKKNSNNKEKRYFTNNEIEMMVRIRKKLIAQKWTDREIAGRIAEETGRSKGSVYLKIRTLVKRGVFPPNPNKRGAKSGNNDVQQGLSQAADAMEHFGGQE